jgi:hypothetical protein
VCEIPMYTRNYVQEGGGIRLGRTAQGKIPLEEVKS